MALHPDQYRPNEAWIAFKLNDDPVRTDQDGNFDAYALMDAASGFILGMELVPADLPEPDQLTSRRLLKQGHAHRKQWPAELLLPDDQAARFLAAEAERAGIRVSAVPADHLLVFIGEARNGFAERFG